LTNFTNSEKIFPKNSTALLDNILGEKSMEEIRPIKPEESEEFNRLIQISFAAPKERNFKIPTEVTLCAFIDGKMATTYGAWPLNMEFNGKVAPVAGVTMVSSLPVYRRKGYLRKITEKHFNILYESGERSIATLFASMAAIYQRYGYGIASFKNSYAVSPRHLRFSSTLNAGESTGTFREATDNDNAILLDIYKKFSYCKTGYMLRNEQMEVSKGAPFTVLNFPFSSGHLTRVVYSENNTPLGYLIYCSENSNAPGSPAGQNIIIRDLCWLSVSAYNAIWQYLSNMDLIGNISWSRVPPDDPLPHLLLEPRKLNITTGDGLLARIIDVEKALKQRGYSEEGSLVFELDDDLCPWNTGKWELEVSKGEAIVKRTGKKAQATIPVSTLAMILFGQISASEAARMGRLDVYDHNALYLWDKVMRTKYRPFCADLF